MGSTETVKAGAMPPNGAKDAGPISGKKTAVPPVNPKRTSLTSVELSVERSAVENEKRFED